MRTNARAHMCTNTRAHLHHGARGLCVALLPERGLRRNWVRAPIALLSRRREKRKTNSLEEEKSTRIYINDEKSKLEGRTDELSFFLSLSIFFSVLECDWSVGMYTLIGPEGFFSLFRRLFVFRLERGLWARDNGQG